MAEEKVERRALPKGTAGHAPLTKDGGQFVAQPRGEPIRMPLRFARGGQAEGGDTGGSRQRMRVVRARMGYTTRPGRRSGQQVNEIRAAAYCAARHAPGEYLAEDGQVGNHTGQFLHAARGP